MEKYIDMTDDELITLAQSGDDDALETVLVRYKPLVYPTSFPSAFFLYFFLLKSKLLKFWLYPVIVKLPNV